MAIQLESRKRKNGAGATGIPRNVDVLVAGGGNAGICAALSAAEAGATVVLLESDPVETRGGNSKIPATSAARPMRIPKTNCSRI